MAKILIVEDDLKICNDLYSFKTNKPVDIISLSTFNKINRLLGKKEVHLSEHQYLMA